MSNITIGSFINFKNVGNSGYLDTCGWISMEPHFQKYGSAGAKALVQTTGTPDRDRGSGTWKIVSADNKAEGEILNDTDRIRLLNCWPGLGYLALYDRIINDDFTTVQKAAPEFRGGSFVFTVGEDSLNERLSVATFNLKIFPDPSSDGWVQDNPITTDIKVAITLYDTGRANALGETVYPDPANYPVDNRGTYLQPIGPRNKLGDMQMRQCSEKQTGLVFSAANWGTPLDSQLWTISLSNHNC